MSRQTQPRDTQNIPHPTAEYTGFLNTLGMFFSRMDCTLSHSMSLNKYKKVAKASNIFSDHNGIKVGIYRRKRGIVVTIGNTFLN